MKKPKKPIAPEEKIERLGAGVPAKYQNKYRGPLKNAFKPKKD